MKSLNSIHFHCDDETLTSRQLWESTNVSYIFSCVLAKNKVKTLNASKLNVYLSRTSHEHALISNGPIAIARISIGHDHATQYEHELAIAAFKALSLLEQDQGLNLRSEELLHQVLSTNFRYHFFAAKRIPNSKGMKLRVDTTQKSTSLSIQQKNGSIAHLLSLWPSPWLFLISHLGQKYDRELEIDFLHSKVTNPLFSAPYADPSSSAYKCNRTLLLDNRGRTVERFSFRVADEA